MITEETEIMEIIFNSVSGALEEMAFSEVDHPESAGENKLPDSFCWSHLSILEPAEGDISIVVPLELAYDLVSGIYAMSKAPPSDEILKDSIAELLNTIAGLIMEKVVDEDTLFKIGLPETEIFRPEEPGSRENGPPSSYTREEIEGKLSEEIYYHEVYGKIISLHFHLKEEDQ